MPLLKFAPPPARKPPTRAQEVYILAVTLFATGMLAAVHSDPLIFLAGVTCVIVGWMQEIGRR